MGHITGHMPVLILSHNSVHGDAGHGLLVPFNVSAVATTTSIRTTRAFISIYIAAECLILMKFGSWCVDLACVSLAPVSLTSKFLHRAPIVRQYPASARRPSISDPGQPALRPADCFWSLFMLECHDLYNFTPITNSTHKNVWEEHT